MQETQQPSTSEAQHYSFEAITRLKQCNITTGTYNKKPFFLSDSERRNREKLERTKSVDGQQKNNYWWQNIQSTNRMLINRKKLLAIIPLSERTIFNLERRGEFPHRIALTSRNVAWDLAEVEAWIEARKSSGVQAMRPGSTPSAVADRHAFRGN